jgi:hypothetical protein
MSSEVVPVCRQQRVVRINLLLGPRPVLGLDEYPATDGHPAGQDAFLANWVGVDRFSDSTVEQLGSAAQCYEGVKDILQLGRRGLRRKVLEHPGIQGRPCL